MFFGKTWQNLAKVGGFLQLFELKQKEVYLKSIAVLACSVQRIADRERLKARAVCFLDPGLLHAGATFDKIDRIMVD